MVVVVMLGMGPAWIIFPFHFKHFLHCRMKNQMVDGETEIIYYYIQFLHALCVF